MENKHSCKDRDFKNCWANYGVAINRCFEEDDGTLWVTNDEYSSQVKFCPYCGYKAKNKTPIR